MTKDEDGRVRPSIAFGVFYTQRYRQDQPCVLYQGTFLSRSEFEKRGGAAGNRWHTSIKVRPFCSCRPCHAQLRACHAWAPCHALAVPGPVTS